MLGIMENKNNWETLNARDLGMCCVGCDCGHCKNRRVIISKIELSAIERTKREIDEGLPEPDKVWQKNHPVTKCFNACLDEIKNKLK